MFTLKGPREGPTLESFFEEDKFDKLSQTEV